MTMQSKLKVVKKKRNKEINNCDIINVSDHYGTGKMSI